MQPQTASCGYAYDNNKLFKNKLVHMIMEMVSY